MARELQRGITRKLAWRVLVSIAVSIFMLLGLVPFAPVALAAGNEVTFLGGGYGHGVGMSQYGARGQALDGFDHHEIIEHYYTGASIDQLGDVSPDNPLEKYNSALWLGVLESATSFKFKPKNGSLSICHSPNPCPAERQPQADELWTFKVVSPGVCIFEFGGEQQGDEGDCWIGLTRIDGAQIEIPSLGKTFGHGKLRVRPVGNSMSASKFHVSFSMDLEDYLLGIAEMPTSWPTEALRAQAVAARSYAAGRAYQRETGERTGSKVDPAFSQTWYDNCWCHVRATTSDQAYSGWAVSQIASWAGAVSATEGEIVTHSSSSFTADGVVVAFYSSSTSGVTETNIGGFGSTVQYPFLLSVDDHWGVDAPAGNPNATWSVSVPAQDLIASLAATSRSWKVDYDLLTNVELVSGPPEAKIRFTGLVGPNSVTVEAPGWWVRTEAGLKSPQITSIDSGLGKMHGQNWTQDTGTIQSSSESGDHFGQSAAVGDFDGDGHPDAGVGAPTDGIGSIPTGGLVNVLYGTGVGLSDVDNEMWHQDISGVGNLAEADDRFGSSLAAGDFDGDGKDDLAVGAPMEDLGGVADVGIVEILYGSGGGLKASGPTLSHDSDGIGTGAESGDRFGATLAAGDFNNDGYDDLAVGSPGEALSGKSGAGMVTVIPGSSSGLQSTKSFNLHQGQSDVNNKLESGDGFGSTLAVGDLDGDGYDDLAVGVPNEGIDGKASSGMVHMFYGASGGLKHSKRGFVHQGLNSVPGTSEASDEFGFALAFGDLIGDSKDDLVIGVPGERLAGEPDAGRVVVIKGRSSRSLKNGETVHQDIAGIRNKVEAGDRFGEAVGVGRIVLGSKPYLLVGVTGEGVNGTSGAGLLHMIPGSGPGLVASKDIAVAQDGLPEVGVVEAGDGFGALIYTADFDGDLVDDMLLGSSGEDVGSVSDAGWFQIADNMVLS